MYIIGVTGGVGAGKTETLNYLEDSWCADIFKTDDAAKEIMKKGGLTYPIYLDVLGNGILGPDGEIDRQKTASLIFGNSEKLDALNEKIQPVIRSYCREKLKEMQDRGTRICILESALMLEEHYNEMCDELWYIYADETTRYQRLRESRGYDDERIRDVMNSQMSDETFRKAADFVIDNRGKLEFTKKQIDSRMEALVNEGRI
jgi:dephospho-CoA kinase